MAAGSIDADEFSAWVLVGGEDREFGIEVEGAVRVALAVDDHALQRLRAVVGFDIDKRVGEAVAGRRGSDSAASSFRADGRRLVLTGWPRHRVRLSLKVR